MKSKADSSHLKGPDGISYETYLNKKLENFKYEIIENQLTLEMLYYKTTDIHMLFLYHKEPWGLDTLPTDLYLHKRFRGKYKIKYLEENLLEVPKELTELLEVVKELAADYFERRPFLVGLKEILERRF